jgi:DNA-binding transcriptional LysR family regulator
MFEIDDLRVFLEAANRGTFTAAAKHLHTTQASVSRHIDRLEHSVGGQLFDRTNRRSPHLTPLGTAALPLATQLIAEADRFDEFVHLYGQGKLGVLSIALSEPVATAAIPVIARHMQHRMPGIGLQVRQCVDPEDTVEALRAGAAELGVLSSDFTTDELDGVTFAVLQHLAIGAEALLGNEGGPIEWDELAGLPLLLPLPKRILRYPMASRARVVQDNAGPELLLTMAAAGLGVAILTSANRSDGLIRRPIEVHGVPQRSSLLLTWTKGRSLTAPARALTDDMRRRVAQSGPSLIDHGLSITSG